MPVLGLGRPSVLGTLTSKCVEMCMGAEGWAVSTCPTGPQVRLSELITWGTGYWPSYASVPHPVKGGDNDNAYLWVTVGINVDKQIQALASPGTQKDMPGEEHMGSSLHRQLLFQGLSLEISVKITIGISP